MEEDDENDEVHDVDGTMHVFIGVVYGFMAFFFEGILNEHKIKNGWKFLCTMFRICGWMVLRFDILYEETAKRAEPKTEKQTKFTFVGI